MESNHEVGDEQGEEQETKLFDCEVFVKSEEDPCWRVTSSGSHLLPEPSRNGQIHNHRDGQENDVAGGSQLNSRFSRNDWTPSTFCPDVVDDISISGSSHVQLPSERKNSTFQCEECPEVCKSEFHLTMHKRKHGIGAKCLHCSAEFTINAYLTLHMKRMHSDILLQQENQFRCRYCQKPCRSQTDWESHVRGVHRISIIKLRVCEECGEDYSNRPNFHFEAHKQAHGPGFKCSQCPAEFRTRYSINAHLNRLHPEATHPKIRKLAVRSHPCDGCEEVFISKEHLLRHKTGHRGARFKCNHCGAGFATRTTMNRHKRKFHPEKRPPQGKEEAAVTATAMIRAQDGKGDKESETELGSGAEAEKFLEEEDGMSTNVRVNVKLELEGQEDGKTQTVQDAEAQGQDRTKGE